MLVNKSLYGPARLGRLIIVKISCYVFYQRIQQGNDPAVYLRTIFQRYISLLERELVQVGIHREEIIRIIQGGEQFTLYLTDPFNIKFHAIPWRRIGNK